MFLVYQTQPCSYLDNRQLVYLVLSGVSTVSVFWHLTCHREGGVSKKKKCCYSVYDAEFMVCRDLMRNTFWSFVLGFTWFVWGPIAILMMLVWTIYQCGEDIQQCRRVCCPREPVPEFVGDDLYQPV